MPKNTKPEGDMLQGTLDMLILRTLLAGPLTDTRSPMPSNSPPMTFSKWSMVLSTRLSIAWKIAAGSRHSGARPKTIEKPNTIA
jgi:hypothetical protein